MTRRTGHDRDHACRGAGRPGPPQALVIRELPVPEPRPGWVLIRVKAFGINRSELHTRLGLAHSITFPRVLGIEATASSPQHPQASSNKASKSPP